MSFDVPDWDDIDPGEKDDEPEDWDDNWHWYDDPPRPPKEEPDCYSCNDGGCRSCQPTRLDVWRSEARYRLRHLWGKLRRRRNEVRVDDPWAPVASSAPPASSDRFTDEPPF